MSSTKQVLIETIEQAFSQVSEVVGTENYYIDFSIPCFELQYSEDENGEEVEVTREVMKDYSLKNYGNLYGTLSDYKISELRNIKNSLKDLPEISVYTGNRQVNRTQKFSCTWNKKEAKLELVEVKDTVTREALETLAVDGIIYLVPVNTDRPGYHYLSGFKSKEQCRMYRALLEGKSFDKSYAQSQTIEYTLTCVEDDGMTITPVAEYCIQSTDHVYSTHPHLTSEGLLAIANDLLAPKQIELVAKKKLEAITYTIPTWCLCPLFNSDDSGLEDSEIEALDSFIEREGLTLDKGHWSYDSEGNEAYFSHTNDVTNLGDNVVDIQWVLMP